MSTTPKPAQSIESSSSNSVGQNENGKKSDVVIQTAITNTFDHDHGNKNEMNKDKSSGKPKGIVEVKRYYKLFHTSYLHYVI